MCRTRFQNAEVKVKESLLRSLLEPHWASRLLWHALIIFFLVPQVFIYKFLWEREITSQVELS